MMILKRVLKKDFLWGNFCQPSIFGGWFFVARKWVNVGILHVFKNWLGLEYFDWVNEYKGGLT